MFDWATAAVTALSTGLVTTLALNFVTAERRLGWLAARLGSQL